MPGPIDEERRRRFESSWRSGHPEAIEACLPARDDPRYLATLLELVLIDLEFRWKARAGSLIDGYREAFPDLDVPEILERLGDEERLLAAGTASPRAGASDSDVGSFGRYQPGEELASGGMGMILGAVDPALGRRVAIKILHEEFGDDPEDRARFVREARITGQLEHPNIVPIHELERTPEGREYFAMKLVEGESLAEILGRLREAAIPAVAARDLRHELLGHLLKVCDAVAFAHARGVVHRDLKPANIMVGRFGEVLVMDWGIAFVGGAEEGVPEGDRVDGETDARLTLAGTIMGTPAYMPPEQADGSLDGIDARSDIFALGAILFEILTLRLANPEGPLRRRRIPSRRDRAFRVPRALDAVASRAMALRPENRYRDVREFQSDIQRHLQGRRVSATTYSLFERLAMWMRRNPRVSWVASAGLLLLAIVGVWSHLSIRREQGVAEDRFEDILRLADMERLRDLQGRSERLWPARPEKAEALARWLGDARVLVGRLPGHRQRAEQIRDEDLGEEQRRWIEGLGGTLIAGLENLETVGIPEVEVRYEFARTIRERSIDARREAWNEAIEGIRAAHGGLEIEPQLGLVPLGQDPESGLWEFAHLQSGVEALRGTDGRLRMTEETGIVFVLLPGGTVRIGADRARDPGAESDERPIDEVDLAPFFLSKYEMTQGQWLRFTGSNPSYFLPGAVRGEHVHSLAHPVERVTWDAADRVLFRLGLVLPTEARWEYAVRGGTGTPWWAGDAVVDLRGAANLADATARRLEISGTKVYEETLDDGYWVPAPVGTFRPNPFGLHETIGNVGEWCRDRYDAYENPMRPGDGLRRVDEGVVLRVYRGGSFGTVAAYARSADRHTEPGEYRYEDLGLRPARSLDAR